MLSPTVQPSIHQHISPHKHWNAVLEFAPLILLHGPFMLVCHIVIIAEILIETVLFLRILFSTAPSELTEVNLILMSGGVSETPFRTPITNSVSKMFAILLTILPNWNVINMSLELLFSTHLADKSEFVRLMCCCQTGAKIFIMYYVILLPQNSWKIKQLITIRPTINVKYAFKSFWMMKVVYLVWRCLQYIWLFEQLQLRRTLNFKHSRSICWFTRGHIILQVSTHLICIQYINGTLIIT